MKYKLKEHVTDEMLIACGFNIISLKYPNAKGAYRVVDDKDTEIYIPRFNSIYGENIIQYAPFGNDDEVLEEHIQDLIDLEYVEVVGMTAKEAFEKLQEIVLVTFELDGYDDELDVISKALTKLEELERDVARYNYLRTVKHWEVTEKEWETILKPELEKLDNKLMKVGKEK